MLPSQPVLYQWRTKSRGIPFMEILLDPGGLGDEFRSRTVKLSVMLQTVHTDFKSNLFQTLSHRVGNPVLPFRHKIEAGTEAVLPFKISQLLNPRYSFITFYIVREDQREPFAIWPARPTGRSSTRFRIDRPHIREFPAAAVGPPSPQRQTQAPGHDRLEKVIGSVYQHGRTIPRQPSIAADFLALERGYPIRYVCTTVYRRPSESRREPPKLPGAQPSWSRCLAVPHATGGKSNN